MKRLPHPNVFGNIFERRFAKVNLIIEICIYL